MVKVPALDQALVEKSPLREALSRAAFFVFAKRHVRTLWLAEKANAQVQQRLDGDSENAVDDNISH